MSNAVVFVGVSFLSMSPSDVPGFFYAEAAVRHILIVQKEQGIEGALAEIGVHHGKSFATMLDASASGVPVVAIHVFEDQHLNYDRSGNTTQDIFLSNLRNVFTASRLQQIVLHKGDSMELKSSKLAGTQLSSLPGTTVGDESLLSAEGLQGLGVPVGVFLCT